MVERTPRSERDDGSAEEPARLRRDFDALREQFEAADEVLSAMGRSASDPETVLATIVESARRLCRSNAAHLYLIDDGIYRLIKSTGLDRAVDPLHRRAPDARRPGHPHRASRARSQDPADPGRARRSRTTAGTTSSGSPGSARRWAPRCCIDDQVVGALGRLAHRRQPVRRARDGHRHRVRGPGGDGGQRRDARPAAGGAQRRAGPQGRRARGVCARSGRPSARASTSTTCCRPSRCTPSGSRAPTAARSWSTPSRTAASGSGASSGPTPTWWTGSGPCGSTSTRRWSVGPRASAARSPCPTSRPSTSTPTSGSSTTPDGARWPPSRCCARPRSSAR